MDNSMESEQKSEMRAISNIHLNGAGRSEWESVFSSVKAQVPSLDSDTSVSDGEDGDLFIFQRDEANLIPDLSDELMDVLSDDPEMQEIFGHTQPPKKELEGVLESSAEPTKREADLSGPGIAHDPLRKILLSSTTEDVLRQPETDQADCPRTQTGEHHCGPNSHPNVLHFIEEPHSEKQNISQGLLSKPTEIAPLQLKEAWTQNPRALSNQELSHHPPFEHVRGSTRSVPKECGVLSAKPHCGLSLQSLQCLEQWDLDTILQNLEEQGDGIAHTERNTFHGAYSVRPSLRSETRVMEQLKLLCVRQSQGTSNTRVGAAGTHSAPTTLSNRRKEQNRNSSLASDICHSPSNISAAEHVIWKCPPQLPTIYIDLRNAQPQESELLPAEFPEQAQRMGYTGKSLLLKQLRSCRKVPDPPSKLPPMPSPQEAESRQDPETLEEGGMPRILRKRCLKVRREGSKAASPRRPMQSEAEAGSTPGPKAGSTVSGVEKETEEDLRSASAPQNVQPCILPAEEARESSRAEEKQVARAEREDELKEKHRRQRLQQQLETLKPRHSITGKQPMAEKTPVFFHMEASYLPDISMLPAAVSVKQEMFLMTIWLSSCGHVASAGLPGGRTLETAISAVNIYHALVTWLISLVPTINVQGAGIGSDSSIAPFQVVGLQQTWREDGLALYACLVPCYEALPQDSPKTRRHKVTKEDLRGMSAFYQKICKYLSHTWLQSVTWWREALTDCLQHQIFPVLPEIPAVRLSSVTTINPDPKAVEKAFASLRGFYWQTVETDEKTFSSSMDIGDGPDTETEVAMALLFDTLLSDPLAFHHMLQLILSSGLDICGLRLLYPQSSILLPSTENVPSSYAARPGKTLPPVLAIALRGPQACDTWQDISGPCDPQLARLTDRHSLNALYCHSRAEPLLYSPHTEGRVLQELCVWFGGRVPSDGVVQVGIQNPAKSRPRSRSPSDPDQEEGYLKGIVLARPPATLISTSKGDIFLAVSPVVPPSAYGDVISICSQRGFTMQGVRRLWISTKRASMLNMSTNQIAVFCPSKPPYPMDGRPYHDDVTVEPHLHTLLLLLRKENAGHHVLALIKGLMNEMAEQGLLAEIQRSLTPGTELQPSLCFHVAHYTDNLLQGLGGSLNTVPECGSIFLGVFSQRTFASNPEMEQVVIFTLTGKDAMKGAGSLLRQILRPTHRKPHQSPEKGDFNSGFELLGLKWLPRLTRSQAKEVTPFEVGDRPWQPSIDQLVSSPALICALRRINAFVVLAEVLKTLASPVGRPSGSQGSLQRVMSSTPEIAFRQAALFFTNKDFVSDARNRPALNYIPPPIRGYRTEVEEARRGVAESIFSYMLSGPQLLCTVLLLKPGGWARSLAKILRKLNLEKFCVVAMKSIKLDSNSALELLPPEVKQDPTQLHDHCSYLTSDLSLVLCIQRQNAVRKLLDLLGPDDPNHAQAQDGFLWRGQYGTSPVKNGFYGSTCYQTAVQDMKRFFPEGLCCAQSPVLEEEKIFNVRSDPLVSLELYRKRNVVKRKLTREHVSSDSAAQLSLGLPLQSALCQTTCLVLPDGLLQGCNHPPYIPLLEHMVFREFVLTGARLTRLDKPQAHHVAELLCPVDNISATRTLLIDGSCLVLAAQRDNAVSCFHSLIESTDCQKQVVQDCMQLLLYPKTEKQAEDLLCCFFDSLTQDSIHQIAQQGP